MPELPEVETIKRQLSTVLSGQVIESVRVLGRKSFIGNADLVRGSKVLVVSRRAKVLDFGFANDMHMLVHLKMTGQLIYQPNQESRNNSLEISENANYATSRIVGGHPTKDWIGSLPSKHTRVVFTFNKGVLYFNDQRMFGWVKIVKKDVFEHEFSNFGPDIVDEKLVTSERFYSQLSRSRVPIKLVILDQKRFAGVGNIYANDGLWEAGISPKRAANSLTKKETQKLLVALRKVMDRGIELGGASETNFIHINGMGGKYQEHFLTYKRNKDACLRSGCSGIIVKVKLGGRGTYYCPTCQK